MSGGATMRIRVTYRDEYMTLDVTDNSTVKDVKEIVRIQFYVGPDGGSGALDGELYGL